MTAFLEKEMEIVAIRPSIMRDIDVLLDFAETFDCEHLCSGNCRRVGCNCECGEWHIPVEDAAGRVRRYLKDVREAESKEQV